MQDEGFLRPVKIFPTLYRIEDFLVKEHPVYHPDTTTYDKYWSAHEKLCIEGKWGLDSKNGLGGWRYMPGCLYYYVNFCEIADEDEEGNTTANIKPMLRDVEWMFSYAWTAARGFSGFKDDEDYTCSTLALKLRTTPEEELSKKEKKRLGRIRSRIFKPDGSLKEYMKPYEYLCRTHSEPKGLPLYDNDAENLFWLGSRGTGKSYSAGNMVIGHEFNFFGKRYYNDSYLRNPAGVEIFVGSAIAAKSSDLLKKFEHTQEYLKTNFGAWGVGTEEFIPGFFALNVSGSLTPNNSKSPYRHEYRHNENGSWLVGGTKTKIHHGVYTSENPQAAVGTRPTCMIVEEVGLATSLLEMHASNETCMIRKNKFGSALYIGTGGNIEKIFESRIIFEDPASYNCVQFPDVWENRIKPIGFFMPAYYVDNDFKDDIGNTYLQDAFDHEMEERKKREGSNNSFALDGYIMARPMVPSEMFLSRDARIFPTTLLRKRYADVVTKELFEGRASIGHLEMHGDAVKWKEDVKRKGRPIIDLNIDKYLDISGEIVIFEHPEKGTPPPSYRRSLYKITYDPVKDDGEGTSLASILVYKGFPAGNWNSGLTDTIVAEYIGRYDDVEEVHKIAIMLAKYYNAKVMPETNIPDFVRYCKRNGYYTYLQPSPHEAISRVIKNPGKKYDVGVQMSSKNLGIHCEQLIRTWLLTKWGDPEEKKTNIDKLYSRRLLQELIHYDRMGNFDHVSSLKVLALWLSQEADYTVPEEEDRRSDVDLKREALLRKQEYLYQQLTRERPFHVY